LWKDFANYQVTRLVEIHSSIVGNKITLHKFTGWDLLPPRDYKKS